MPICPQCGNRPFANKEALLQHMKTSSAWHPFCAACDRRFSSKDAFTAHMNDKHPPTFDCTSCNRQFQAPYALDDHYRGSQLHPNCVRCGRGFKDAADCEEHHHTAHPKTPCLPCGGILLYEDTLEQHYKDSGNHPSCNECDRGFKENSAYNEHFATSHPDIYCAACQIHFSSPETLQAHTTVAHPSLSTPLPVDSIEPRQEIDLCLDGREFSHPIPVPVPTATLAPPQETKTITDIDIYSTGFTPLSAIAGDPMRALIVGEKRIHTGSPDLRLELANMAYSSPLTEVKPLFSPTVPSPLPRPGGSIERFWTSRENITTPRRPYRNTTDPASVSVPTTSWLEPVGQPPQSDAPAQRRISPPLVSRGLMMEFNPRLYPGSVRQAMRATANGNGNGNGNGSLVSRRTDGSSTVGPPSSSGSSELSFNFNRGLGVPLSMDAEHLTKIRGAGSQRSFTDSGSQSSSCLGRRGMSLDWPETSLFSETLTLVQTPTPKLEGPNSNTPSQGYDYLGIHSTSPSLATLSSPASSLSVHHEDQLARSPEVTSPVGLGTLPTISPLAATPLDLYNFDFPEARKPLPESPVAQSPVTVVLDVPVEPEYPQAVVSERSPATVDKSESHIPTTISLSTTTTTTTTPTNFFTAAPSPTIEPTKALSVPVSEVMMIPSPIPQSPIPQTPIPLSATRSNRSTGTSTSAAGALHPNPLHCRVCLANTCDDITASMCGHVFCNRCITDAVIKTNRCPVCMTPTLLYCLFRLDLAA